MNNTQKLYEIQISANGENLFLTKETRSPFVKSDVFAMPDYKRTTITLVGGDGVSFNSGKAFFDCKINRDTQIITQEGSFNFVSEPVDLMPKVEKEPTLVDKIFGFFKRELPKEEFRSHSFICIKNGDSYHFIGALNEASHALYFDVLPFEKQVVCKVHSEDMQLKDDSLLFDIIEIQGSTEEIIDDYYSLVEKLYHRKPKVSPQLNVCTFDMTKNTVNYAVSALAKTTDYMYCCLQNGDSDLSVSAYIQQSEPYLRTLLKVSNEKIFPMAVISPLLCEKGSTEYGLFAGDIAKNAKGKAITTNVGGKNYYILDVYSRAVKNYIVRQLDILFSMGFCGVKFLHLDCALNAKAGKSGGHACEQLYDLILRSMKDKCSIAKTPHSSGALGKFDYLIVSSDVLETPAVVSKVPSENTPAKYDFTGFENLASYFEVIKKFPNVLPIGVPATLLENIPQLFDLCTAFNMLVCKSYNIIDPTYDAIQRSNQFDFLKDAQTTDVIQIETGRYAIVFYIEDMPNACFFNFTKSDWIMDDITIPKQSFEFKE